MNETLIGGAFPNHAEIGDLHEGLRARMFAVSSLFGSQQNHAALFRAEDFIPVERQRLLGVDFRRARDFALPHVVAGNAVWINFRERFVRVGIPDAPGGA